MSVNYKSAKCKVLTSQEVNSLLENPTKENKGKIVVANIGLVISLADHLIKAGNNIEYDDLIQVGICALYKAIKRFKSDRGCAFSSYAYRYVKASMGNHIRKEYKYKHNIDINELRDIDASVSQKEFYGVDYKECLGMLNKKDAYLIDQIYGKERTMVDLAHEFGVSRQYVHQMKDKVIKKLINRVVENKVGKYGK